MTEPSDELDWGDGLIACHAGQPAAARFSPTGWYRWELRDGRHHCPFCGSVHPRWLWETFAPVPRTRPPWFSTCDHRGHTSADDFRACERAQLDAIATWVGMEFADWKHGYPHKLYLYAPRSNGIGQRKFYTQHLTDLPAPTMAAVAEVIEAHTGVQFFRDEHGRLLADVSPRPGPATSLG